MDNYGIVYLLTNSAMPGLVKIGMTTRENIDERMYELYNHSGVPVPFECKYACKVKAQDCSKIEKALHKAFSPNRINTKREFFNIQPEQAMAILEIFNKGDVTKDVVEEIENDLDSADKKANENIKKIRRRPPLNFKEMGINIGSKLVYVRDNEVVVEISAERKVLYQGKEVSLTAVTSELLNFGYDVQPTSYWEYEGRNLRDIYDDVYTLDDGE